MIFFKNILKKTKTPKKNNIIFFGTPEFAASILETLLEARYHIVAVVTQPDKVSGRNKTVLFGAVKRVAHTKNIPVLQPQTINQEFIKTLQSYRPDIAIVVAYGKILPSSVLQLPEQGCINIHGSLLPLYRGASPIQNALLNGDKTTGISLMRMDEGMDTGPVYAKKILPLSEDDVFPKVSERLAKLAGELLLESLPDILKGKLLPLPQKSEMATHCQLIEKEDGRIYWNQPAREIFNAYRAFYLWPGIHSYWKKKDTLLRLKLLRIRLRTDMPLNESYALGEVYLQESGVFVRASVGSIELLELQQEGKKALSVREFVRGSDSFIGTILQ